MKRKLIILVVLIGMAMCYKIITCFLPSKVLNPYFETHKTGYTWLGYEIYEHKNFFSNIVPFKYFFIDDHNFYILKFGSHTDLRKKKYIKIKSFSLYDTEYKQSGEDFDLEIFVLKIFDFNLSLGDTLRYYKKEHNKILTQKFYDTSIKDTLYYFVSEQPLELENYPFKEAYLVGQKKGIISILSVNENVNPIEIRFLCGEWNSNLYKDKKIKIRNIFKKEEVPKMNEIDIKQLPAFKKECFW